MQITIACGFTMTLLGAVGSLTAGQIMNGSNIFSVILFIIFLYILLWGLLSILVSSISFYNKDKLYVSNKFAEYQKSITPAPALVFGIIGFAFAVFSGAPGAFFSSIGLDKANDYRNSGNVYSRKVTVGRVLSIIGLAHSLIEVVTLCIVFIILTASIINA